MSLGETIYRLRTEKNLSQGDLAEMLEVSRQSVSKWENNSAVPDLEKIIRLSEIFEMSLDELVKGEKTPRESAAATDAPVTDASAKEFSAEQARQEKEKETGFPPRKIAGTILLCMAFFVSLFFVGAGGPGGIIFALPFLTCGILCFVLKRNVGLWCAWDVYVLLDLYMLYGTGISRASVLYTFRWTQHMNYMRLAFAWIMVLSLAAMMAVTVVRLGKRPFHDEKKGKSKMIAAWIVLVLIQALAMLWARTELYQYMMENIIEMGWIYSLMTSAISWARIVAFTVALVYTVRYVRMRRQK